ncbi:MAG: hypothetical protein ACJ8H8_10640, partial [Geminicoccaceae bacterium]
RRGLSTKRGTGRAMYFSLRWVPGGTKLAADSCSALQGAGAIDQDLEAVRQKVQHEVDEAAEMALAAPMPERERLFEYVYAQAGEEEMAGRMTYVEAIREALAEEMERDDRVLFMRQDVGRYGGLFVSHIVLSTPIL